MDQIIVILVFATYYKTKQGAFWRIYFGSLRGTMLRVGSGKTDITPPVGLPLSGFAVRQNKASTSVDDTLYVKAMVIESMSQLFILLSYDLLGLDRKLDQVLRLHLKQFLGERYDPGRVLLTATHNHSGPTTLPIAGETRVPGSYVQKLQEATISAVAQAIDRSVPAECWHASIPLRQIAYNRRLPIHYPEEARGKDPQDWNIPGLKDDFFDVFVFRSQSGICVGAFVNFACHAVTMITQHISADYPGELTRRLEASLGAVCLFLQGAAGDMNPVVVSQEHAGMLQFVDKIMNQIAELPPRLQRIPIDNTTAAFSSVDLPFAPFPPEEQVITLIRKFERIKAGDRSAPDLQALINELSGWRYSSDTDIEATILHWAEIYRQSAELTLRAARYPADYRSIPCRLAVWKLGPFRLIFVAGEVLSSLGDHIRDLAPGFRVQVISCLAPMVGYLADLEEQRLGGYEPGTAWMWYQQPGPFQEDIEYILLEAIRRLLS